MKRILFCLLIGTMVFIGCNKKMETPEVNQNTNPTSEEVSTMQNTEVSTQVPTAQ